jgi:hypothetical protein
MKKSYIVLAMLLTMMWQTSNAFAAEFEGAGLQLCSKFLESYKIDKASTSTVYFDWAEGYMSGLNVARLNDQAGAFQSMPIEQQQENIRTFCEANPGEKYFKAVIHLYATIYPKQNTK